MEDDSIIFAQFACWVRVQKDFFYNLETIYSTDNGGYFSLLYLIFYWFHLQITWNLTSKKTSSNV